jgi:transposase
LLEANIARFVVLPAIKVLAVKKSNREQVYECEKTRTSFEVCTKCAAKSSSIYDHRWVSVRDEPLRRSRCRLKIRKRRYWCHNCRKPFTEPIDGILPRERCTQRFKRAVLWACENFTSLSRVREHYQCSSNLIYKTIFSQLELKLRQYDNPWPKVLGIDEHFFTRRKGYSEFFTVFVDLKRHRVREAVLGRSSGEVLGKISHIKGSQEVAWAVMDLSETYRSLVRKQFVNAQIVADKFHVLRLLSPALRARRIEVTGDKRTHRIKRLLQKNRKNLDYSDRAEVDNWLQNYPELNEVYRTKEKLHELYRCKGINRAEKNFDRLLKQLESSSLLEIQILRKTLEKWRTEILNYFLTGLTNAMTEGFNRIASLVKNRGFGYRNENNYRLRFISACAH